MQPVRVLVCFLLVGWLAGCGQTGDLYWPEPEPVIVDEEKVEREVR